MKAIVLGMALCVGAQVSAQQGLPPGRPQPAPATGSPPKGPGSLTGVWTLMNYKGSGGSSERERVQHTVDGKLPPLRPEAAALLEQRVLSSQRGQPFANTLTQCLPGGMPLMMFGAPYPVQVLETPGQVSMLFEEQNHFRLIFLDAKHPEDPDPTFMGDSVAHWESDTLVVDTIGLKDRTTIDQIGMPHSEDLHVVERLRRVAPDQMENVVTIDDPKTFTAPWTARASYRLQPPGTHVSEYICENNRNTPTAEGNTGFQHDR